MPHIPKPKFSTGAADAMSATLGAAASGAGAPPSQAARCAPISASWGSPIAYASLLEKGSQGAVYKVQTNAGGVYAAKAFRKAVDCKHEVALFEKLVANGLDHPTFPRFFGLKELNQKPVLVCEFVQGADLFEFSKTLHAHMKGVPSDSGLALAGILSLARQLFSGLALLEQADIVHGDIKPENLMLPAAGGLKLIDFGFWSSSKVVPERRGTAGFMGPEVTQDAASRQSLDRSKVDCYAACNTVLELLTGYKVSANFETLESVDEDFRKSKVMHDTVQAHRDRRLTAQNFSQSEQPEANLGAVGTFFGSTEPDPEAAALKVKLSHHLHDNRSIGSQLGVATVTRHARALQLLPSTPFDPARPPSLAEELKALLSSCIRSDWKDRPSALTVLERLDALALMRLRPAEREATEAFLKALVQKTMRDKSKPEAAAAAAEPRTGVLKLPKNRTFSRHKSPFRHWRVPFTAARAQPKSDTKDAKAAGPKK